MTKTLVFTLHLKVDAKLITVQKDGQRHLYVKSAITSGTTQYQPYKAQVRRSKTLRFLVFV